MLIPLTTLDRVKAKLQIPLTDESDDEALQQVVDGVIAWISDRTHITPRPTQFTEYVERCQIGRITILKHRPIDEVVGVSVFGRTYGVPANWIELKADVVDAFQSRVLLLGVANFFQTFPPVEPPSSYFKWSQPIWPVVKWIYTTAEPTWPADLSDAAASFCGFLFRRQRTGHLVSASLGSISETYETRGVGGGVPDHIANVIDSYTSDLAQWVP